jgi:methionyl-tRNA formyltransferase
MRFAITATDRYLGVFEAFVSAGWEPLKLFTFPMESDLNGQDAILNFAKRHDVAVQHARMTTDDLAELQAQGCEALVVASYKWKIHDWHPFLKYAVNFHCSPLPDGRGPYPPVRAILEKRDSWAVTCHRLSSEMDKGDIIAVEKFPLQSDECHESIDLKIQMAAKRLATGVARQFVELWGQAKPQEGGSYWEMPTVEERVIHFQMPVEHILRQIRAYGSNGSFALIDNSWLCVTRAVGWKEHHTHLPSQVVHTFNRSKVVAALDGFIGILEYDLLVELGQEP